MNKKISDEQLKQIIEAALFISDKPLTIKTLQETVLCEFSVSKKRVEKSLQNLVLDYAPRGISLVEVASGFRFQSCESLSHWLSYLSQEKAPKYSRALLETLSLIAYRQPVTRGEIENVRGVSVSSQIIKTLMERDWIKVVGRKNVPGQPALYATTKTFLDYLGIKSLEELPPLQESELPEFQLGQHDPVDE